MSTSFNSDVAEVREIIRRCCRTSACARLVVPESDLMFQAWFTDLTDEMLTMRVESDGSIISKLIMTNSYISFADDPWSCFFFASIVDVRADSETQHIVTLNFPDAITAINARKTHRVPVGALQSLPLVIKAEDGRIFRALAKNIGLTGMSAEIIGAHDPQFAVGQHVEISLQHDDGHIRLNGQIRTRHQTTYGLLFPSCIESGTITAPDKLSRLVRRLERAWIRDHAV